MEEYPLKEFQLNPLICISCQGLLRRSQGLTLQSSHHRKIGLFWLLVTSNGHRDFFAAQQPVFRGSAMALNTFWNKEEPTLNR